MNTLTELTEILTESMADLLRIESVEDCLRVTTQCLYPSNGFVRVFVKISGSTAIVSDERAALNEAQSAGLNIDISDRGLRHVVAPYGARVSNGNVLATVPIEAVPITVIFVANASRSVAAWLYDHLKIRPQRDFRFLLANMLQQKFTNILHQDIELAGVNKKHKFANLISLPRGRRIIIDPVSPEPASINGRIVAHLDVQQLRDATLDQRLIYDDTDRWTADNLGLLSVGGATAVPFSRSEEVLERLAHA